MIKIYVIIIAYISVIVKGTRMKKKLLVYRWGSLDEPILCETFKNLNIEYEEFAMEMKNYHADALFAGKLIETIHSKGIQAVISYDYFPMISMICEMNGIPYISWIYDCPQYTLLSKTLGNSCNYIFCFDRIYTERLKAMGAVNCYHYPLAGVQSFSDYIQEEEQSCRHRRYQCDISFIGNLYNEDKNRLQKAELSSYTAGYIEGLVQSQLQVYGYNFLKDALNDTVIKEIVQKCNLILGKEYVQDERQMAADAVGMEVSARERERVLEKLSSSYAVTLYTSSKLPESLAGRNLAVEGYADYQTEVPLIYYSSKINLNITSKTIESGIPQRVFDILSCGGFCLTNYQPEIAEYFKDGEELVIYTGMEDMMDKTEYYLKHGEERKQIATKGYLAVKERFSMERCVEEMLEMAGF